MITRQEYLSSSSSLHQEYFLQFGNPVIRKMLESSISVDKLRESTDPYFNDIPLKWWDNLANYVDPYMDRKLLKEVGEINSLSVRVCTLKAIARDMVR
jgi:hypothetical protein